MNILIITHAAGTPEIGPNMRTYYLAKQLVEKGNDVLIVGSGFFHKYYKSPIENKTFTLKKILGITYYWLPTLKYKKRGLRQVINQLDFVIQLWSVWKCIFLFNPDFILVSSPPPFAIYFAAWLAKKTNSKIIFEIRDLWPEIVQELGCFNKSHPYIKMIELAVRKAYKISDGIVSVKPGDLSYIKENYKTKGYTAYIPNGFDHKNVINEEFQHSDLDSEDFKIIYTGALSSYYAIEYLMNAAVKLKITHPKVKIIIAGGGDNLQYYQKIKFEQKLDNVIFLGILPKKYMLNIIKKCDVAFLGLVDTKANRFGISTNKLFEYMYAQKPVIASYKTDYDVVKKAGCGITVPPESEIYIYHAVVQMYEMTQQERNEKGMKGYYYLLEHFTYDIIGKKYINFLQSI